MEQNIQIYVKKNSDQNDDTCNNNLISKKKKKYIKKRKSTKIFTYPSDRLDSTIQNPNYNKYRKYYAHQYRKKKQLFNKHKRTLLKSENIDPTLSKIIPTKKESNIKKTKSLTKINPRSKRIKKISTISKT